MNAIREELLAITAGAKLASGTLSALKTRPKNELLRAMGKALLSERDAVFAANALDLQAGREAGLSEAMLDRLNLNEARLLAVANALEKIAALENLEASEEDIAGEYKRIAEAYGITEDQVKESIDASAIAEDMKVKKAMDLVKEKAVIGAKKPAAKKTTAKKTTTKKAAAPKEETAVEGEEAPKAAPKKKTTKKVEAEAEKTDAE